MHDHFIWSYLLPRRLDGGTYLVFLQEVLPVPLQSVPANMKARMCFQHDGAPAHFSAYVRSALDTAYPGLWIGRGVIRRQLMTNLVTLNHPEVTRRTPDLAPLSKLPYSANERILSLNKLNVHQPLYMVGLSASQGASFRYQGHIKGWI
ncbi:uncharacterized protein TNCV_5016811 [Trichonephila clavipes]|nr:uncharacterized protein TNCV_5016811 [Trichonephila clavipes]